MHIWIYSLACKVAVIMTKCSLDQCPFVSNINFTDMRPDHRKHLFRILSRGFTIIKQKFALLERRQYVAINTFTLSLFLREMNNIQTEGIFPWIVQFVYVVKVEILTFGTRLINFKASHSQRGNKNSILGKYSIFQKKIKDPYSNGITCTDKLWYIPFRFHKIIIGRLRFHHDKDNEYENDKDTSLSFWLRFCTQI